VPQELKYPCEPKVKREWLIHRKVLETTPNGENATHQTSPEIRFSPRHDKGFRFFFGDV
jgi:hypothetical protein